MVLWNWEGFYFEIYHCYKRTKFGPCLEERVIDIPVVMDTLSNAPVRLVRFLLAVRFFNVHFQ